MLEDLKAEKTRPHTHTHSYVQYINGTVKITFSGENVEFCGKIDDPFSRNISLISPHHDSLTL